MVELAVVRDILCDGGLFDGLELDKGVVALHIQPDQLPVGSEEHFEVFSGSRLLVKVDYEEGVGGLNVLTTGVFLALDPAITTGKLRTKAVGYALDLPET